VDRAARARLSGVTDMPPLQVMVLDSMVDDAESVDTLRSHGEVAPYGLALVAEADVMESVRSLLTDGLAEALGPNPSGPGLVVVASPQLDAASLRSYWFRPTAAGEKVWLDAEHLLDAYWEASPIED
jgi:hypothetical protein